MLEMENIVTEVKNAIQRPISRPDKAEERNSEFGYKSTEITQTETQREEKRVNKM